VCGVGVWQKVEFAPHPYFRDFFNVFTGFIECSIGCGKMSTLRHTLKAVNIRAMGDLKKEKIPCKQKRGE
jgi:hypothetical protein